MVIIRLIISPFTKGFSIGLASLAGPCWLREVDP
jgi:hypothetical protein